VTYTYPITVTDVDAGDALTLTAPALPAWLTLTQVSSRTATLTSVPTATGDYPVVLEVSDGEYSATQTFTITVANVSGAPVADAGPDQTVHVSDVVRLDGSDSFDPDGDLPLTCSWRQIGGLGVTLSDSNIFSPTFTAPSSAAELIFSLVVTDAMGAASTSDSVIITVSEHRIYLPLVRSP